MAIFCYGIGFDLPGSFTHSDGGNGKNVINFGADLTLDMQLIKHNLF